MDIGILGGTFDPVHLGHLIIAEKAREAVGLDAVIFVPAGRPPHRETPGAPAAERLAMVALAVADNPRFSTCDYETRRDAPSYTLDTVRFLAGRYPPGTRFRLLLGADAFAEIGSWHRVEQLAALVDFLVISRPGAATKPPAPDRKLRYRFLDIGAYDFSAREIRRRCAAGLSIRYLVPAAVGAYIERHRLYRATTGPVS